MSAAKQEQLYIKQLRHLQDKIRRCEESTEQKEKNITINKAKCIAIEQDTKDITEYLEFDVTRKQQRLAELQELYKQQTEKSRLELEEIDEKNNKNLQNLENELEELTSNLLIIEAKHAEVLHDLQKQVQSRKDRLAQNQKNHIAKIKQMQEEELDAEMVASALKESTEIPIRDEFTSLVKNEREYHQMWRDKLAFLKDIAPQIREQRDDLSKQLIKDQESLMEVDQDLQDLTAENKVLRQYAKKLRDIRDNLEKEVQVLKSSVEDHECNMKCAQDRLIQKMAKISATCQKQKKEIDLIKAAIEVERSSATELSMAMKEADIIFKHITEEPKMELWKLKRLLAILESYAEHRTF